MPTSERKRQLVKTKQLRAARQARREEMLEHVVCGDNRVVIARRYDVSLKTVQREVDRALDARRLRTPDRHLRLQTERLDRALRAIDDALDVGDVDAVGLLLKVMEKLDYYQGLGAAGPTLPTRRLAHDATLSLTHERTETQARTEIVA